MNLQSINMSDWSTSSPTYVDRVEYFVEIIIKTYIIIQKHLSYIISFVSYAHELSKIKKKHKQLTKYSQ